MQRCVTCSLQCEISWPVESIANVARDEKYDSLGWETCLLHLGKIDRPNKTGYTRKIRKICYKYCIESIYLQKIIRLPPTIALKA